MKDPSRSSTTPSIISDDLIVNGQSHDEDNPFAEYMWMENEEEFNRQIEEELWEEEFIERCFQEMLEEEEHEWFIPARDLPQTINQLQGQLNGLVIGDCSVLESLVVRYPQTEVCMLMSRAAVQGSPGIEGILPRSRQGGGHILREEQRLILLTLILAG
ncbi:UNVERIFIED_CONTAM: hypothetical protein FKN15_043786 [Acipenser sinensis]